MHGTCDTHRVVVVKHSSTRVDDSARRHGGDIEWNGDGAVRGGQYDERGRDRAVGHLEWSERVVESGEERCGDVEEAARYEGRERKEIEDEMDGKLL